MTEKNNEKRNRTVVNDARHSSAAAHPSAMDDDHKEAFGLLARQAIKSFKHCGIPALIALSTVGAMLLCSCLPEVSPVFMGY